MPRHQIDYPSQAIAVAPGRRQQLTVRFVLQQNFFVGEWVELEPVWLFIQLEILHAFGDIMLQHLELKRCKRRVSGESAADQLGQLIPLRQGYTGMQDNQSASPLT